MSKKAQVEDVGEWVRALLRLHGVPLVTFGDGSTGLINVPAKWSGIINDMHTGMNELAEDGTLPVLSKKPAPRKGGRR